MTVIKRTPDLGIGIRLQRPATAPDAAAGAGWLAPGNVGFAIVAGSEPWLPAHIEIGVYANTYDGPKEVDVGASIVGVVSGETVTGVQWEWYWRSAVPYRATVEVVDGHLRATLISITGSSGYGIGDSCTLTATAKTASGFTRTITALFYLFGNAPQ
ncbi:MAG: hypothetical protein LBF50_08840 [Azoarcus sp.]|jgi:hypothetical protein|nr:hypothetical protein [Azoarcus sp.]